jgi:hypothetical protein
MLRLCATLAMAAFLVAGAETPGALSVATDPAGAAVYVDGQFVGRTPIDVKALQPGDHRVRLVKDGYLENGRVVNVASGKTGTLQVRLTERGGAGSTDQAQGGGISSGGGGISKKWLWIGAAGGGAAAAYFLTRSSIDSISANPATGLQAGSPIRFSAAGVGSGSSLSWDFGDGSTSSEQSPSHVFNTTGTFSVKCTVGGSSATTTVTIKSLTGTWRGTLIDPVNGQSIVETFVFTQSGTTIGGTMSDVFGPGTLSGTVNTSAPLVRVTIKQEGFSAFIYTADPNADVNALNGVLNQSGFNNTPLNLTRQ